MSHCYKCKKEIQKGRTCSACRHEYYIKNKERCMERQREYRQTEKGKKVRCDNIRKRRKNNSEEKHKHRIQEMTRCRLKKMDLSNKVCEECGGPYEEFHHIVYDKNDLLNGQFLCKKCHRNKHNK